MKKIVVVADLGGTNLRVAGVTTTGEIIFHEKVPTPRSNNADTIVDTFIASYDSIDSNKFDVSSVCFAVPAAIDLRTGRISNAPNVSELVDYPLADVLYQRLGVPVHLENDANAAAIGENWLGASKGSKHSLMLTLGTGVGGGIIIDGKIVRGAIGAAGEIGHFSVEPEGVECGCGSHGCIEQYASATAVARMASELGIESENGALSSFDVYNLAKAGNEVAKSVFKKQGYYLGVFLGGMLNSLNPECVVIGGGAARGWDLFIDELELELEKRAYSVAYQHVTIKPATLGDDAGILGAAHVGFKRSMQ